MTKTIAMLLCVVPSVLLAQEQRAHAITLPDINSPCSTSGLCFRIKNTGSGAAIAAVANGTASGATAISGTSNGTTATISATNNTTNYGEAVRGDRSSSGPGTGYAIYGLGGATSVFGQNSNGNGVSGESDSGGVGVTGKAFFTDGVGVAGNSYNSDGSNGTGDGVQGVSGSGFGVHGMSDSGVGVFGSVGSSSGYAGYFQGDVYATGTYQGSDARLKKDIKDSPYGVGDVLRLRPVTYRWKANDERVQLGLIAQEVQGVIPEVVRSDASQMLSVNYTALVPVLIKALQEQQGVIARQDARIASLERRTGPILSSMATGGLGVAALALVPLGMVARRRNRS